MVSRTGLILAGFAAAVAVLVVALLLRPARTNAGKPVPIPQVTASTPQNSVPQPAAQTQKKDAPPESRALVFRRDGDAAGVIADVERAAGADHATVAIRKAGEATWAWLLVDAPERYVDLDQGWTMNDFPVLAEQGFTEPPAPYGRTMSIFKSLAKSALQYNRARGDRVVVMVCPKAKWKELGLEWPAPRSDGP